MNFQIVILMAVVACAFALPVPDEEVSTIKKNPDVTTTESILENVEDGLNTIVGNATSLISETASEVVKATDAMVETSSVAEEEIQEVPKSLPVLAGVAPPAAEARAESVLAGIVPPVSEVRAEPKEAVEIAEAKSSVSSPDAEDKSDSSKPVAEVKSTTEGIPTQAGEEKKSDAPATEDKPEVTESSASPKLPVAGENKTEDSSASTADAKKGDKVDKSDKSDAKSKPKDAKTDKHDHSQESNKSEDSAESKESEESEESKKN